jgi:hypothetical protein
MTPHDLAAAHAIDALNAEELDAFTPHLDECPSCQDQVASVREAAARLGASGVLSGTDSPGAAPTSLRSSVLASAASTPQVAALDSSPVGDPNAPAAVFRTRRHLPVSWIGTAAAAILAAALGMGVGGYLASKPDAPILAAHEQAMRIISAPDAHTMNVPLGRSSLVMSEGYAGAVLMGDTTPMPAHGKEYQVWMEHPDGSMAPGPTFMPDADGTYMVLMTGDMGDVATVLVTTEPSGGSTSPTGPTVAEVSLGT